jgi:hypothetical protein
VGGMSPFYNVGNRPKTDFVDETRRC